MFYAQPTSSTLCTSLSSKYCSCGFCKSILTINPLPLLFSLEASLSFLDSGLLTVAQPCHQLAVPSYLRDTSPFPDQVLLLNSQKSNVINTESDKKVLVILWDTDDVRWPALGCTVDQMFGSFQNVHVEALIPRVMALCDPGGCWHTQRDGVSGILKCESS